MFDVYLHKVMGGEFLNRDEAYIAADMLLHQEIADIKAAAFLAALRSRKEQEAEFTGFAQALLENSIKMESDFELFDNCGTGGDGLNTFNISTAASLVIASCGVYVAKHGNRAVSSRSGSADVLEALGFRLDLSAYETLKVLEKTCITFLLAPSYNPILKKLASLRKAMGVPTIFNFLGPFLNPLPITYQVMGIFDGQVHQSLAQTLRNIGRKRALMVYADNGMDEISPVGITYAIEIKENHLEQLRIDPKQFGFFPCQLENLKGKDAKTNAAIIKGILSGTPGPPRDAVLINAAAGLMVAGRVKNLSHGIEKAAEAIDSGKAFSTLKSMVTCSQDGVA